MKKLLSLVKEEAEKYGEGYYEERLEKVLFSIDYLKKHPNAKSNRWWCLIPADPNIDFGLQYAKKGRDISVDEYTEEVNGFTMAQEKIPSFENKCESCGQLIIQTSSAMFDNR